MVVYFWAREEKGGKMKKEKWKTEKKLKAEINKFFRICEEEAKPVTRTSLAVYLGLTKDELMRYMSGEFDSDEVVYSKELMLADTKIEEYAERLLFTRDKGHTAIMFYLKTNFGWTEKVEEEKQNEDVSVNISVI